MAVHPLILLANEFHDSRVVATEVDDGIAGYFVVNEGWCQ
jgi:hypothetical protein